VDNQIDGVNPHDRLDPRTSAQIIISHVTDGLEMARRHRLPPRLQDFIPEHHGTTLVNYFHHKALEQAGEDETVDEASFRYAGPRPRSKETAIIMLADGCESAVRAARPGSREEIDHIVRKIINRRLADGELDESDLTLRDLDRIRQAFVKTLQGIHHPRIQYPEPVRTGDKTDDLPDSEKATLAPAVAERPVSAAVEATEQGGGVPWPVGQDRRAGQPSPADVNRSPSNGVE
jgi:membrane-associated HD superfamily phosphohydrolase